MESILKDLLMPRNHVNVNEMDTSKLYPLHYFVIKASDKNKYSTDAFAIVVDAESETMCVLTLARKEYNNEELIAERRQKLHTELGSLYYYTPRDGLYVVKKKKGFTVPLGFTRVESSRRAPYSILKSDKV